MNFSQRPASVLSSPWRWLRLPDGWTLAAMAASLIVVLPVLAVAAAMFAPAGDVWAHLMATSLDRYIGNTLALAALTALGAIAMGVPAAWLATMYEFPGRRFVAWALLLPLAMPTYVLAYAYTDLLQFSGPVQTALRATFDWHKGDYWFPAIRSLGGAACIFSFALYPYVYLLARSAFLAQSVCALEAGRTLGAGPWRCFFTIAVPLSRPAIMAGAALVLMETLADFGAVQYFAIDTFTVGIYRTWFALGEPMAAAQLAALLMLFALTLLAIERYSRGQARYHHNTGRYRHLSGQELGRGAGILALLACLAPPALGFGAPMLAILRLTFSNEVAFFDRSIFAMAWHSFILAAMASLLAVAVACLMAYGRRLRPTPTLRAATQLASMGYAIPGSVIAIGVLIPLGAADRWLDAVMREHVGISIGLFFSGTVAALIYAYLVRFLAVSFHATEAGLGKINPNLDHAARILGRSPWRALREVHAPMMRGTLATAFLLTFVDTMKELPATMIIRPFNFDTLAVRAHVLASDERLAEAGALALAIVAVGIIPVLLLARAIGDSRPGSSGFGSAEG
jgi:iron(III) transport system permease protein